MANKKQLQETKAGHKDRHDNPIETVKRALKYQMKESQESRRRLNELIDRMRSMETMCTYQLTLINKFNTQFAGEDRSRPKASM